MIVVTVLVLLFIPSFLAVDEPAVAPRPLPRLSNGDPTDPTEFPHHVFLFVEMLSGANDTCTGSLITYNLVLTSSDCFKQPYEISLSYGVRYRYRPADETVTITWRPQGSGIYIHPSPIENIALIKLPVTLEPSPFVQTIQLPTSNLTIPGLAGYVPGLDARSGLLSTATVLLRHDYVCKRYQHEIGYDPYRQLCASMYFISSIIQRPCSGDHGAGLVLTNGGNKYLVGIYVGPSRYTVYCNTNIPFLFTNVYKYLTWIHYYKSEANPVTPEP